MDVSIKRVYDPAAATDGTRVLVDRIWPRGLTRTSAAVDLWLKDVAPSTELRKWFAHDPARWTEFQARYRAELTGNPALATLRARAEAEKLTLVFAAKDTAHSNAAVLRELLAAR